MGGQVSLSVDVGELDDGHKVLISVINELDEAMQAENEKEVLRGIINKLVDYTRDHFTCEEKFFLMHKYPDTSNHMRKHNDFVGKIMDFRNDFEDRRVELSMDIMRFLKEWLLDHILITDQEYSSFFNAKGLV